MAEIGDEMETREFAFFPTTTMTGCVWLTYYIQGWRYGEVEYMEEKILRSGIITETVMYSWKTKLDWYKAYKKREAECVRTDLAKKRSL